MAAEQARRGRSGHPAEVERAAKVERTEVDQDLDRRSTGWELTPVTTAGLVSIELTYASDRRCDARANCEVERAAFTFRDAIGRTRTGVVDVHLACQ